MSLYFYGYLNLYVFIYFHANYNTYKRVLSRFCVVNKSHTFKVIKVKNKAFRGCRIMDVISIIDYTLKKI